MSEEKTSMPAVPNAAEQPYDWATCTKQIQVVIVPGQPIILMARTHADAPIVVAAQTSDPTDQEMIGAALVDAYLKLEADFPRRQKNAEERKAAAAKKAEADKAKRVTPPPKATPANTSAKVTPPPKAAKPTKEEKAAARSEAHKQTIKEKMAAVASAPPTVSLDLDDAPTASPAAPTPAAPVPTAAPVTPAPPTPAAPATPSPAPDYEERSLF